MPVARLTVQVHHGDDAERAVIDPVNHGIRKPLQACLACLPVKLSTHLGPCFDLSDGDLGFGDETQAQLIIHATILEGGFFQLKDSGVVPGDVHADLAVL